MGVKSISSISSDKNSEFVNERKPKKVQLERSSATSFSLPIKNRNKTSLDSSDKLQEEIKNIVLTQKPNNRLKTNLNKTIVIKNDSDINTHMSTKNIISESSWAKDDNDEEYEDVFSNIPK